MSKAEFQDLADRILRDLEIPALRARYRALGTYSSLNSSGGNFYFYTDPYEFVASREGASLDAKCRKLNALSSIAWRRLELAADGIWPRIVTYSEPGNAHLVAFVEFGARGKRTLARSGLTLAGIIPTLRRYSFYAFAPICLAAVAIYLAERFWRNGWQALMSLVILFGFAILIRRFRR